MGSSSKHAASPPLGRPGLPVGGECEHNSCLSPGNTCTSAAVVIADATFMVQPLWQYSVPQSHLSPRDNNLRVSCLSPSAAELQDRAVCWGWSYKMAPFSRCLYLKECVSSFLEYCCCTIHQQLFMLVSGPVRVNVLSPG